MGEIIKTPIIGELEQSFLDYSLSVITDRAIPSAEDGLKPVARRILWDMWDKGYKNDKKFVKCAQPVGDTMGRFHPHGDSSIYGALAWLSQPWNMRYPLIEFHGNNGSRDGDEPAAYRYTECRLSKIGEEMLADIKKNTVDWSLAYTDTESEPVYLPGLIPNLLVNGTSGIAVAMACSYAPHNLTEIMNGAIKVVEDKDVSIDDLHKIITGPDFPTGGLIINKDELINAYKTGKGRARIRGEYVIESDKRGFDRIVFTSIPYKVSKEDLIVEIDKLCEEGVLTGVESISDETTIEGVRFVIELAKGVSAEPIIKKLFKKTNLETTYSINQVSLVDKAPKTLNLKQLLENYIAHQKDVLTRKTEYDLAKARVDLIILEALLIALNNIDDVVDIIKKAKSSADAKVELMEKFSISEQQAKAILDMKLAKLSKLEKEEIEQDKINTQDFIKKCEGILANPDPELITLFTTLRDKYGDARRSTITQIVEDKEEKEIEFVEPEKCVVVMTEGGLVKRVPSTSFRTQKRNGKGVKTQNDITSIVIRTNTIDQLMVFTDKGNMYRLLVDNIPVGTNISQGQSIKSLVPMAADENATTIYSIYRDTDAQYVMFTTKNGLMKKTALDEYVKTKKKTGIAAINIKDGDELASVTLIKDEPVLVITKNGMAIKFNSTEISPSGRTTAGMKGITLGADDQVITCLPIRHATDELALFSVSGLCKKVPLTEFPLQKRAGKGLICYKISDSTGEVAGATLVEDNDMVLVVGDKSSICVSASDIPSLGRASTGNQIIKGSRVSSVSKV